MNKNMKKENYDFIKGVVSLLWVLGWLLAIFFFTNQQFVVFEINKKYEKQYPCFTSVDKTKWCGGGSRAIENLLDKLNKGEWAVDFIPILTSQ